MPPKTLYDLWCLYEDAICKEYSDQKARVILDQTQTALVRHTLPGLGGPVPKGRKITKSELEHAFEFMSKVSLKQFEDALNIQATVFDKQNTSKNVRHTYRSRLKHLIDWSHQQPWCCFQSSSKAKNRAPKIRHGFGDSTRKRTTTRRRLAYYGLNYKDVPPRLCCQLDELYSFLTQTRWPGRLESPLKPKVADQHIKRLCRILGWFIQHARPIYDATGQIITYSDDPSIPLVSIESLTLDLLVPKVFLKRAPNKDKAVEDSQKAADSVDIWLCKFLDFLDIQRESQSAQSLSVMVSTVHVLVRFQYHTETDRLDYQDIPVMGKINQHFHFLKQRMKIDKPVSDVELQWLELPDVWQRIVRPLREECAYRYSYSHLRSDAAIAKSFLIFVLWGMLTFRPPRRQQEFRDLKISSSCPLQKPSSVREGQMIHPLPVDRESDKYAGYLYKDEDGIWYMDMMPESYKTGKTYGHQKLRIPNESLADGKSFYDYLEAFLYGYYRDSEGDWLSGGQLAETPDTEGEWHNLRMLFDPQDDHLFIKPKTGKSFEPSNITSLVQSSAHRLTGQKLPPHLLRDIFATWFLDQGYSPDRIASLAYAMGHREETLRKIYDRRRPRDKTRPIEEALAELIHKFVS